MSKISEMVFLIEDEIRFGPLSFKDIAMFLQILYKKFGKLCVNTIFLNK